MTYYPTVYQPKDFPVIVVEIRRSDDPTTGFIGAVKRIDDFGQLAPASVTPNVSFRADFTPTEAREIAEWWEIAADCAEFLDVMVKTRGDLYQKMTARAVGKVVTLEWEE